MALIGPTGRPLRSSTGGANAQPPASGVGSGSPGGSGGAYVKDSSIETFAADVLDASRDTPVIVDFWAPWCGPCKQLGPLLEKVVNEAKGAVRLVKVNIDENQEIARQLRIQSIPTVYAFKNGQPVDGFMGAVPESQIRAFVQQLTGGAAGASPTDDVLAVAEEAFAAGDLGTAAQAYAQALQDEPGHPKAVAGLARCYLKSGDVDRARKTLQLVRPDGAEDESIRAVGAEVSLREQAAMAGDASGLRARIEANSNDHQARYDLALALDAQGDRVGALEALLDIVRRDRNWNEQAARKHLVTLFEAMGPADPRTVEARRKLSSILFA
ncbi:MAG: thioredoxin [Alphaproteobacteria bacterium]|nr:thioredoxin [Alphaproteobacteria bacterium]